MTFFINYMLKCNWKFYSNLNNIQILYLYYIVLKCNESVFYRNPCRYGIRIYIYSVKNVVNEPFFIYIRL